MPRTTSQQSSIRSLVDAFVTRLAGVIEAEAAERTRQHVLAALGDGALPRRRGRPPKNAFTVALPAAPVARRRAPKQLCPVPGCKNAAAPVFGMVCAEHKDLPKEKIAQYREERRAAKVAAAR